MPITEEERNYRNEANRKFHEKLFNTKEVVYVNPTLDNLPDASQSPNNDRTAV